VTRDNLRLRLRVEDLESALAAATLRAPAGAEDLAQGEDLLEIKIDVPGTIDKGDGTGATELGFYFVDTTWNEAFAAIAPLMIDEANESELKRALLHFLHQLALEDLENDDEIKDFDPDIDMWDVFDESFQTIKVQLRALGYIKQSEKPKSLKLSGTYWTLTPLGDQQMTRLRAVRRRVQGGRPEVFP
jgi:hypothetical protein